MVFQKVEEVIENRPVSYWQIEEEFNSACYLARRRGLGAVAPGTERSNFRLIFSKSTLLKSRYLFTGWRYSGILPSAPQARTVFAQTPSSSAASLTRRYPSRFNMACPPNELHMRVRTLPTAPPVSKPQPYGQQPGITNESVVSSRNSRLVNIRSATVEGVQPIVVSQSTLVVGDTLPRPTPATPARSTAAPYRIQVACPLEFGRCRQAAERP